MIGFLSTIVNIIETFFHTIINFFTFFVHAVSVISELGGGFISSFGDSIPLPLLSFAYVSLSIMIVRLVVSLGGH